MIQLRWVRGRGIVRVELRQLVLQVTQAGQVLRHLPVLVREPAHAVGQAFNVGIGLGDLVAAGSTLQNLLLSSDHALALGDLISDQLALGDLISDHALALGDLITDAFDAHTLVALRVSPVHTATWQSFTSPDRRDSILDRTVGVPVNHVARTRLGGSCVAQHLITEPLVLVQGVEQSATPTLTFCQPVLRVIAVHPLVVVQGFLEIAWGHLGTFERVHCGCMQCVLRRLFRGPRLAVQFPQLPTGHVTEVLCQLGLLWCELAFLDP